MQAPPGNVELGGGRHDVDRLRVCSVHGSVQFSSPGLTWCRAQALHDHDTVINVIDAVVAGMEKLSEVAGMKRGTARR